MRHPSRRTIVLVVLAGACAAAGGVVAEPAGPLERVKAPIRQWVRHHEPPRLEWPESTPEAAGLSRQVLDELRGDLSARDTKAFLVARHGQIVYEWYSDDFGPNLPWPTSAVAKGLTASPILARSLGLGAIDLDEPAYVYVPEWRDDPVRAAILVRHLAFHSSGIENVSFVSGADGGLAGWKRTYYEQPSNRFRLVIERVPVVFAPGSRYEYSGVGYYALAYILAEALARQGQPDLRRLLRDQIMRPLEIPDDAWEISYGTSYSGPGHALYAIGSGARYTGRTAARIAELFRLKGRWNGRAILDEEVVERLLDPAAVPDHAAHPDRVVPAWGAPVAGWYLNREGAWSSLPEDAFATFGDRHQVVVVVPSWDLVAVRFGGQPLGDGDGPLHTVADARFFSPLALAVRRGRTPP